MQCPSCKGAQYVEFALGATGVIRGLHCGSCGYYKLADGRENYSVEVLCNACQDNQWLLEFPNPVVTGYAQVTVQYETRPPFTARTPVFIPAWRCPACQTYNNIYISIRKSKDKNHGTAVSKV